MMTPPAQGLRHRVRVKEHERLTSLVRRVALVGPRQRTLRVLGRHDLAARCAAVHEKSSPGSLELRAFSKLGLAFGV